MTDVLSSSEDEDVDPEEIILMARCAEAKQKVYIYGRGNGPIGRDSRVKTNKPINVCRELTYRRQVGHVCTRNADL